MQKITIPFLIFLLVCGLLSAIFGVQSLSSESVTDSIIVNTSKLLGTIEIDSIIIVEMQMQGQVQNPETKPYVELDETEKLIFATLIAYECGGSSYETKLAVASVIINRMKIWNYPLREVIFAKNQFSPAQLIDKETGANQYMSNGQKCSKNMSRGGPYEECWLAVEEVCENGPSIPSYVIYFRSGRYHNWDTLVNYAQIGPMYFSYAPKYTRTCSHCGKMMAKNEYAIHQNNCM